MVDGKHPELPVTAFPSRYFIEQEGYFIMLSIQALMGLCRHRPATEPGFLSFEKIQHF